MSLWTPSSIRRMDGFQREWWIRTSTHKKPLTEKTELITYSDPILDDCKVKMMIVSPPINHRGELRDDVKRATDLVEMMSENDTKILKPEKWTISQMESIDRIGPIFFNHMPFDCFLKYWRKPLKPRQMHIIPTGNGTAMISFKYGTHGTFYNMYLNWRGLFDDVRQSPADQKILPWLARNCKGRLYLISDFESIFEDPEDEFHFITDVVL